MKLGFYVLALFFSANVMAAETRIKLQETVISGNEEVPKVLYIVPWQDTENTLVPASNPLDESDYEFEPIYPDEFRREMTYRAFMSESATTSTSREN